MLNVLGAKDVISLNMNINICPFLVLFSVFLLNTKTLYAVTLAKSLLIRYWLLINFLAVQLYGLKL